MKPTTHTIGTSESLKLLAGGIAHDFNNLLSAIVGNIALAKMRLSPDDETFRMLTDAENASMCAKDLTHRLLAFAYGGAQKKVRVSVSQIVKEAVRRALSDSAVTCSISADEDLWTVEADEEQMIRVMCSLLTNARESMPEGGRIAISAENYRVSPRGRHSAEQECYVRISVKDEGSGIPGGNLGRVFDPYFTTKPWGKRKGLGLSLAICLSTVQAHGGLLTIESEPGTGTTATVLLPACGEQGSRKRLLLTGLERCPRWKRKGQCERGV